MGKLTIRVTKSQVAFRRRKNVAVAWMPGKYLKASTAPLVLTLSLERTFTGRAQAPYRSAPLSSNVKRRGDICDS